MKFLQSQRVRVSQLKVTKKKVAKVAKDFCVFRLLLPCIEHTICMHQNVNGWHRFSDVLEICFLSDPGPAKFSSEIIALWIPFRGSQDRLQNFHGKQSWNCCVEGRFKKTDLANVGTRSNEHMMNICENVSNIKSQWSTTNKYMRGQTIHSPFLKIIFFLCPYCFS